MELGWFLALPLHVSVRAQLWLGVLGHLSAWHLEFSQQLLTQGKALEIDVVKLFFLSAASIRSLGPFHIQKAALLQPGFCSRCTWVALYPKMPFSTLNIAEIRWVLPALSRWASPGRAPIQEPQLPPAHGIAAGIGKGV